MTASELDAQVRHYAPVAYAACHDRWMAGADRDDVRQEALIGCWIAVRDFNPAFGVALPSWISFVVRRRVDMAVKLALRLKHGPLNDSDRDLDVAAQSTPGRDTTVATAEAHDDLARLLEGLGALSELERHALKRVVNGVPYKGEKSIDNAAQRARRKLAERLAA